MVMNSKIISADRLNDLIGQLRARKIAEHPEQRLEIPETVTLPTETTANAGIDFTAKDKYGNPITLNEKQQEFVRIAVSGKSAILIGAAGTGKTTSQFVVVQNLIHSGIAGLLNSGSHKHLRSATPGIVVCAYTRRAVANIRKNMPADMQNNCITIHKLLEYQPVYYDVEGSDKMKMVFEPTRNKYNPLPSSIRVIIFEETSMLAVDLYKEVIDACPHNVQFIFLGDIQQLPPIFGPAILGFKLLELPVVELTEVYRQALESPIISLAHRVLSANPIPPEEFPSWKREGQLTIRPWKKKIGPEPALNTVGQMFCGNKHTQTDPAKWITGLHESGFYNPEEDMILIPFNKSFGTDELNKIIGNYLAKINKSEVHEIIAGFNKVYLRVGEKVLFDKEDAIVSKIEKNPVYLGAPFLPASTTLDYWGHDPVLHPSGGDEGMTDDAMDFLLNSIGNGETEDRVKQCSHKITLQMRDSETEISINSAGEVNALLYGYCLTVHKSQGSEWRKVFFLLHQSHATMVQRELLYTGITRAKEELFIVCEPETFINGIKSQRVKGNTLAEKAEFFKGKLDAGFNLEGY